MKLDDKLIFVGLISSAHGINGEVKIKSYTSPTTNICALPLFNKEKENIILKFKRLDSKGQLICQLNEVTNRTEVDKFKGMKLFCLRADLPQTDNDEFYIVDLINLKVVDIQYQSIGIIKNVFNFGGGDIIEVEFEENKSELYPFNKKFFPVITEDYVMIDLST